MFRTTILASVIAVSATALFAGAASAGNYADGGYAQPYGDGYAQPYYGGYAQPCCRSYSPPPPPCCAAPAPDYYSGGYAPYAEYPRLPPGPFINWGEDARYYSGYSDGPNTIATPCYVQRVRVLDGRGGWVWGLKGGCDSH
jgi:hypothetical protein